MSAAPDLLNVERSYLWVIERVPPPHSNDTIIGEKYGWNGVAWCAEFVSVSMREAGVPFNGSASCSVLVARYQSGENGTWLGNPGPDGVQSGDNGFLGASGGDHTFMIEWVDGDQAHCIDGNWGDRVCRVTRPIASIYGFGRPNYEGAAAPDLPPPSQTAGRPWLRLGSSGQAVIDLKTYLNAFAQATLDVNSDVFDDATDAAVRAYQGSRGLEADGVVGTQTYADEDRVVAYCAGLAAAAAAGTSVDDIPAFPGTIKLGSVGGAVTAFQQRFADRTWTITVDGVDGKTTTGILEQYQEEKGLVKDGVGGPKTWASLWTEAVT